MHTASREWCDRVAARNAIEVAKAQRVWQPAFAEGYGAASPVAAERAEAGRADTDKAGVALSAAGKVEA